MKKSHWARVAETAVPLLRGDWKACKKALAKIQKANDAASRYITEVVAPLVKLKASAPG